MHIGFSFKPKTLLIVLAVILGIVAYGVEAFADPLDEDPTPAAELLTDEPASDAGTDTSEVPAGSGTVVINTARCCAGDVHLPARRAYRPRRLREEHLR